MESIEDQRPTKRQKVTHGTSQITIPDLFRIKPYGVDKQTVINWWESRTQDDGRIPWARDVIVNGQWQPGKKAYFVDTHLELYQMINSLPPSFRSFYELVGNQFGWARLFIDLDIKKEQLDGNDPKEMTHVDELVRKVIDAIIENLSRDFQMTIQHQDFFLTCAGYKHDEDPTKCKNSIHITCPSVVFEYNQELGQWLIERVSPSLPKNTLDTSVYGQGVLRLPYTTKGGESRPLLPYLVTFPDGTSTANINDYGDASFWIRCLMKTWECPDGTTPLRYGTAPKDKTIQSDPNTSALCTFTFGNAINIQLSDEARETIVEGLSAILPDIHWQSTTFKCFGSDKSQRMILCIRPINRTTCLVTGIQHKESQSYIVLSKDGYICKCYNPQHSGSIKQYPSNNAVRELVRLINHFHNDYCLTGLLEKVKPKAPLYSSDEYQNAIIEVETTSSLNHIPYPPLLTHRRLTSFVDANMKLGKSGECRQQLIEYLMERPTIRVVFLVHRRALAHHTFAKVNDLVIQPLMAKGLPLLPFENYLDSTSDVPLKYSCVVSIESQRRLDLTIPIDLLILDEVESILPQTTADTNRKVEHYEALNNAIFNQLITNTPHVWCFDAELSEETKWFFDQTRPESFVVYHQNIFQNWNDIKVILYPNNYTMLYAFAQQIANHDQRVYGCFAQKRFMNETAKPLVDWLSNCRNFRAQFYDSDTDEATKKDHLSDVDLKWKEFDVICTTSTIQAGTSFEMEHFDHVFGFFGGLHALIVQDMLQMLGRVRNVGSRVVHLALNLPLIAEPNTKSFITDYNLVERGLLASKGYKSRDEYPNVTPSYFVNIHSMVKTNKSKNRSVPMVIERFRQMGCSVSLAPWVPQRGDLESFVVEMRAISSQAKDTRMQILIDSPDITEQEAEQMTIKLKTGVGLLMEQKCSLYKYTLRRFYDYHGTIDEEWIKKYSGSKAKRLFVINRFLLYGKMQGQTSEQFVDAYKAHEHLIQKRYEQLLAGGELGKHFQSLQLEFVAAVCVKLGFQFPDITSLPKQVEYTYQQFDDMTDKWLIPYIKKFADKYDRPFFPSTSKSGPIFYPKNCNMEAINSAMEAKSKKIRTFLWNVILAFLGLEFAIKNRKSKKVVLQKTINFAVDHSVNEPVVTPLELLTHRKCLLDDIE